MGFNKSVGTISNTGNFICFSRIIHTQCFLVCFSVDRNLASYDNVFLKWVPEVKHFCPDTPFILVGTKIDLRDDPSIKCFTPEEGKKLKRKVRAQGYKECSALRNEGLEDIFVEAVRVVRKYQPKKPPGICSFL